MTDEARVDAAELVRTIQDEVARRRAAGQYPPDLLARLDEPLSDVDDDDAPEALAVVESARPLRSTRLGGRGIVFGKRAVRRLLAWYVAPIATDQTRFNLAVLRDLRALEARLLRVATPFDALENGVTARAGHSREPRVDAIRGALSQSHRTVVAIGDAAIIDGIVGPERVVERPGPDPLEALDASPAGRVDAVVLAGVVPLLSAAELVHVMPKAWRTLRPGGVVLADAPVAPAKPADPSTVHPAYVRWLHPGTLALLLEAAQFTDHRVIDIRASGGTSWSLHTAVRGAG